MPQEALQVYFTNLFNELDVESENLTIVVDNARIPLHYIEEEEEDDEPLREFFSSSLSALDYVQFPPAFLKEDDRWNSLECSGASDVSMSVPSRTRDSIDDLVDRMIMSERKNLIPHASMDSTERLLRELPLESSSFPTMSSGRTRKQNREPPKSPVRTKDDELPSLKYCPYSEEIEAHPNVGIRRLPESVALGLTSLLQTEVSSLLDGAADGVPSDNCYCRDEERHKVWGSAVQGEENFCYHVDERQHPKVRLSHSRWGGPDSPNTSPHQEIWSKRREIVATPSPRALHDFPFAPKLSPNSAGITKKGIPTLNSVGPEGEQRCSIKKFPLKSIMPTTQSNSPRGRGSPRSRNPVLSVVLER